MSSNQEITTLFSNIIQAAKQKEKEEHEDKRFVKNAKAGHTVKAKSHADDLSKHLQAAVSISSENPNLSFLKLNQDEIKLIADQFKDFVRGRIQCCDMQYVKESLDIGSHCFMDAVKFLTGLLERSILIPGGRYSSNVNITNIPDMSAYLCSYLKAVIMGVDVHGELQTLISDEELGKDQSLTPILNYIQALFGYNSDIEESDAPCGYIIGHYFKILWKKVKSLDESHPVRRLIIDCKMEYIDFIGVMLSFYFEPIMRSLPLEKFMVFMSTNERERRELIRDFNERYFGGKQSYFNQEGRFAVMYRDLSLTKDMRMRLNALMTGVVESKEQVSLQKLIEKSSSYFEIVEVSQRLEDLVLHPDEHKILQDTIIRLKDPDRFDLNSWGLAHASLGMESEAINSCMMLFHGYPGTGKTFSAGVVANELGRELVKIDATNLRNAYYGVTESNIKEMFGVIREINKRITPAPVFLLNEADQIIHKRVTHINSNVGVVENAIQNIFLEELETLTGIFIVTTNLIDYLDEAFFRRFHFKVEFKVPNADISAKLWRLHIKDTIPGADEIDCGYLGKKYTFTGGVIRIVVQNSCYHAMLRGQNSRLTLEDIERFAKLEMVKKDETAKCVGFRSGC